MTEHWQDSIPLEEQPGARADVGGADPRPRLSEPLPVRLIAVEHVLLLAPRGRGIDEELDAFYVGLLGFERYIGAGVGDGEMGFRADNLLLRFRFVDPPVVHESLRPQGIEVLDLATLEKRLIEAEIEYTRQRSTTPGRETLLLLDPAGNWVEIGEIRIIP